MAYKRIILSLGYFQDRDIGRLKRLRIGSNERLLILGDLVYPIKHYKGKNDIDMYDNVIIVKTWISLFTYVWSSEDIIIYRYPKIVSNIRISLLIGILIIMRTKTSLIDLNPPPEDLIIRQKYVPLKLGKLTKLSEIQLSIKKTAVYIRSRLAELMISLMNIEKVYVSGKVLTNYYLRLNSSIKIVREKSFDYLAYSTALSEITPALQQESTRPKLLYIDSGNIQHWDQIIHKKPQDFDPDNWTSLVEQVMKYANDKNYSLISLVHPNNASCYYKKRGIKTSSQTIQALATVSKRDIVISSSGTLSLLLGEINCRWSIIYPKEILKSKLRNDAIALMKLFPKKIILSSSFSNEILETVLNSNFDQEQTKELFLV